VTMLPPAEPAVWRNDDLDWDRWPVETYLAENYRQLHAFDDAVITHHSAYYRQLPPGSVERSVELGAGPNLYPLMVAAAVSRRIDAVEPSEASIAYLRQQLTHGADASWEAFYRRCRELNDDLPPSLAEALARVRVVPGKIADVPPGTYDLASMHFVAESVSEDLDEVAALCRSFVAAVRPGGHLVAAFMENMARYDLGDGSQWPGCPVTVEDIERIFTPYVDDLEISRVDADPDLPDYYGGYTGLVLLTARRRTP
jgi:SAM-dependent methyltransferase